MNNKKIFIIVILMLAVGAVIAVKQHRKSAALSQPPANTIAKPDSSASLPRLLDLGANKCIPCKMMAPILEELKKEYQGKLDVDFIDVWQNPDQAKQYGVNLIPTQIFFDAAGKELYRHEGFFSKEDILGKWKEIGFDLKKGDQNVK